MGTVATFPPPTTPGGMAVEADRLMRESAALHIGIAKAEERLKRLSARLEVLITVVDKQANHLQQLRCRSGEGQVVLLPDYREMKLKHLQHRQSISEAREAIAKTTAELKTRKARVVIVDKHLKVARGALESWGKVIPLRKP